MAGSVVDCVYTDGIDAQFLEFGNVSLTPSLIGDGVRKVGGATRLVVNATDVEPITPGKEGYC